MVRPDSDLGIAIGAETPVVLDPQDLPEAFGEQVRETMERCGMTRDEAVVAVIVGQTAVVAAVNRTATGQNLKPQIGSTTIPKVA